MYIETPISSIGRLQEMIAYEDKIHSAAHGKYFFRWTKGALRALGFIPGNHSKYQLRMNMMFVETLNENRLEMISKELQLRINPRNFEPEVASNTFPYILPTDSAFSNLKNCILGQIKQHIFILGDRGSGKSFCQNRLINQFLPELLNNKTSFFRADIVKLHKLNQTIVPKYGQSVTIFQFMALHAFFVALKYGNERCCTDEALLRFNDYGSVFDVYEKSSVPSLDKIKCTRFWLQCLENRDADENVNDLWVKIVFSFAHRVSGESHEDWDPDLSSFLEKDTSKNPPPIQMPVKSWHPSLKEFPPCN